MHYITTTKAVKKRLYVVLNKYKWAGLTLHQKHGIKWIPVIQAQTAILIVTNLI
ncbi:hypothetical protein [Mucilaginibacter sp. SP1R1]|uniref:hypothetical protein n=1 Tax=Mucilaginibacter sp. SP1R1 TaxID=2723091 RepID=UPI0016219BF5|nr:hypothetical protein [Mucilaginibacter sp. SP1R1]MBB6147775.1 hypothetical protein [Mucilaginibacter sp. SP1R1]